MKRDKLRRARLKKGLSQEVAAGLVGISRTTWSMWETGMSHPYPLNVKELCAFFGANDPAELDLDPERLTMDHASKTQPEKAMTMHSSHALSTPTTKLHQTIASTPTIVVPEGSEEADLFTVGMMALILHQQQQGWSVSELEQRVKYALDETVADMPSFQNISRRNVFHLIASLPVALQHFANNKRPSFIFMVDEVLPFYTTGIPACWHLYDESRQEELERILPRYLSDLTKMFQEPSVVQKEIAGLLSQVHQLMALLEQERENFGRAIHHCQQAAFYGQRAEDSSLQAIALIRQFDTGKENKRILQSLHLLKQAEAFSDQITPLLRGRIFARLAYAYAYQSQEKEAYRYLDLAQQTFPVHPESDASFLYNHATRYILYANQALTYLSLGHPKKAWEAIIQAGEFVSPMNPRNIDLMNHQIQIAIALDNLEQSCCLFETLIGLVKQQGRELDIDNSYDAYQQLVMHWPREQQVRRLEAAFRT